MQKNLNLNFIISAKKDVEILKGFLITAEVFDMEDNLKIGFYNPYPKLKKIIKKNNKIFPEKEVTSFIEEIYEEKKDEIYNGVEKIKKEWDKKKNCFIEKSSNVFQGYFWPESKYDAYVTIWGIYPRFLEQKAFTFPYSHKKKNYALFVIMHELMHFIFYDYLIKNYSKKLGKINTERGLFWDLGEIFNAIILSSPSFIKLHNQKNILEFSLYPEHKKYFPYLQSLWEESQNIDQWIIKGHKYLKNKSN